MSEILSDQARAVARQLTYNGREVEGDAKALLIDLAHALDSRSVCALRRPQGLLLVNGLGRERWATWRERLAYRLARALPSRV